MGEVISFADRRVLVEAKAPPAALADVRVDAISAAAQFLPTSASSFGNEDKRFNYAGRLSAAMIALLRDVLADVAVNGLPESSDLLLVVATDAPGVEMPDWLREKHPGQITLRIQAWWQDLIVAQDRFHISLNFNDQAVPLVIPFAAVQMFQDAGAEFGLRLAPSVH